MRANRGEGSLAAKDRRTAKAQTKEDNHGSHGFHGLAERGSQKYEVRNMTDGED